MSKLVDRLQNMINGSAEEGGVNPLSDAPPPLEGNLVIDQVMQQDRISEINRNPLGDEDLHISGLIYECPRYLAICHRANERDLRPVNSFDRILWGFGRMVENHIRSNYMRQGNRNRVYGKWTCKCEKQNHEGFLPKQDVICGICSTPLNIYQEVTLWDKARKLVANPDLLIEVGGYMVVVEIKSANKKAFTEVLENNRPQSNHIMQAAWYRDMLIANGFRVHPQVIILYCRKDYQFRGIPYHEVIIDPDIHGSAVTVKNLMTAKLDSFNEYRETGRIPARTCDVITCAEAKKCPKSTRCFEMD